MIELEYGIELALRAAIRTSLNSAAATTPQLAGARIIGFWLDSEDESDEMQNAKGLHVLLMAHPNDSEGYNSAYGLEPQRSVQVDVLCVSQPDSDNSRKTCRALYNAVRSVFETIPVPFTMPTGVEFGGCLITNGGSADIDNMGLLTGFNVEMKVSLISQEET